MTKLKGSKRCNRADGERTRRGRANFAWNRKHPIGETISLSLQANAGHLRRSNLLRKEGEHNTMKYIAVITFAAIALSLGACASKEERRSEYDSSMTSSSTGYRK